MAETGPVEVETHPCYSLNQFRPSSASVSFYCLNLANVADLKDAKVCAFWRLNTFFFCVAAKFGQQRGAGGAGVSNGRAKMS